MVEPGEIIMQESSINEGITRQLVNQSLQEIRWGRSSPVQSSSNDIQQIQQIHQSLQNVNLTAVFQNYSKTLELDRQEIQRKLECSVEIADRVFCLTSCFCMSKKAHNLVGPLALIQSYQLGQTRTSESQVEKAFHVFKEVNDQRQISLKDYMSFIHSLVEFSNSSETLQLNLQFVEQIGQLYLGIQKFE